MAKKTVNIGTSANKGNGDPLRTAFGKINDNFDEIYAAIGSDGTIFNPLSVDSHLLPDGDNTRDLGSPAKRWRDIFVAPGSLYIGDIKLSNVNGSLVVQQVTNAGLDTESVVNTDAAPTDRLVNGENEFVLLNDGTVELNGDPFTGGGSTDRLSNNGDEVVLTGGANPYVTFPAITGGDQLIIQGAEVSSVSGQLALTSQNNLNIIANGSGTAPGGSKSWTFGDDGNLILPGNLQSENAINIDINLSDSTLRRWQFGEDGDLTLPAGGDILDSTGTSVLGGGSNKITAQKTYTDSYSDGDGQTLTYTTGSIVVEFNPDIGLYFRDLLSRLTEYFAGNLAYPYNYSNVSLVINPAVDNLSSTVTNVTDTGPSQYTITLGTAHPEPITINEIEFTYNYINTIGLDTVEDFFGIATGDDDIDIRSGRDIDLIAADDIRIEAGDIFQLKLKNLDDNNLDDGIRIVTETDTGSKTWKFRFDGDLQLPAGGTIAEGYVTSNPTIQLTPASPDVASQKLVIKGGGAYDITQNGININYYNNTATVGDTLTFYINSPTYADQTLYWWIYPEGAGISDPGSGTVVLTGASGSFSFVLDSDDNEFTVRVSPQDNNYDPANLGVETGLINADAPTFNSPHHLHLTTGDLTETSIFLGTDDHNVRTTVNGGIEITTPNETNNVWQFGTDGRLYLPSGGDGVAILRSPTNEGIGISAYNDTGAGSTYTLSVAATGPINIPTASTGLGRLQNVDGIEILTNSGGTAKLWAFGDDGNLTLPGGGSIDGSDYDVDITASNDGASTFGSVTINTQGLPAVYTVTQEGGSPGGPGGATISGSAANSPAFALITVGMTVTGPNLVGVTTVTNVTGPDEYGSYTITTDADEFLPFDYNAVYTFTSAGGVTNRIWDFNSLGELTLPQGGAIQETTVTNELYGTTTTSLTLVPGGAANGTQRLEIYSTGGGEGDHIHITSGDQNQTALFLGNDTQYFAVSAGGANYIQARTGAASPSPGTSAYAGANVNIYAGNAGDNGGNVSDGNSGGDVFIASGISTSGLGGDILINTSSGPDGFGSIELSTDGGSSVWTFNKDNQLVFPDNTIQTTAWPGSITKSIQSVTVTTPTAITADVVFGDPNAAGGAVNLVLPASPANGTVVTVKNINAGGNPVYVSTNGVLNMETEAGTIGSGVYATIAATGDFITWIYQSSTTTYRIIG